VLGDDHSHVFPVKIADTKTVSSLKEVIKDNNMHIFQWFNTKHLLLWRVSIPIDDALGENVNNAKLTDKGSFSPVDRLSKVFSNVPEEGYLHIIRY
jgi:hypothetical protein